MCIRDRAESLLGVLHSHLLGEALDDVAAAAFSKPIASVGHVLDRQTGVQPGAKASPPAVPPPAAVDDLVRLATAKRAASIACLIIELCGADVAATAAMDFGEVAGDVDPRGLVGGGDVVESLPEEVRVEDPQERFRLAGERRRLSRRARGPRPRRIRGFGPVRLEVILGVRIRVDRRLW